MSSLWINPFPLIIFVVLLPIIIPLLGIALVTSFIALITLLTLAAYVYVKLGIGLIIRTLLSRRTSSSTISTRSSQSTTPRPDSSTTTGTTTKHNSPPRAAIMVPSQRRRRLSSASSSSPVAATFPQRTGSFASLIGFDQP